MIFAAIDPGAVNAAIAVFHDDKPVFAGDLPTVDRMLDAAALAMILIDASVSRVVVENVHSMPKQGVSSSFRFGMGVGIIHGVTGALRLPLSLVAPTVWKSVHKIGADKEKARQLAIRSWPHLASHLARKKDADRAEALLIGDWYYVTNLISRTPDPFQ